MLCYAGLNSCTKAINEIISKVLEGSMAYLFAAVEAELLCCFYGFTNWVSSGEVGVVK